MPLPKLAWAFEGSTTDYITGLTGTTTGTVTYSQGKYNKCLNVFNVSGTSAASNLVTYNVSLGSVSGFTVTTWVRMDGAQSGLFQNTIIGFSGYPNSAPGTLNYFNMWQQSGSLSFRFYGQNGTVDSSDYQPIIVTSTTPTIDTWYHYALTVSPTTFTVYINGVQNGTPVSVGNAFTLNTMFLGRSGQVNALAGINSVDDLRIFDQALTSAQVQSIYNQQGVPGQSVQTNTRGLLDVINTPTAASFSLRQLTSKYTGPVVLVRRQSDLISNNFVADFSGNLSNVQNGTTLQTFLTSTYGNVTTWYDQSGNGRNASQASATNAPVIIQTSNLNMKWALTTTYANPAGSTFLNVSGGTFLNATDFTIMSTSRRTITSNSKTNNALYAYGANSSWQGMTSNVTYPDNSRFVCEFPYQGNRASWNQRANPQNAEAFATIPYYIAGSEPITYLSLVSKGSTNQTTLYCNNAVVSTTAGYAQCTANASTGFTIGCADKYGSFGGEIGELIIFPSALTAAQVSQNYNSEVKNSSGGVVSLTGTPLFTQLSPSATSSAVGAFSLRAVNGLSPSGTARAVAVQAHPVVQWPPVAMTSNTTVVSGQLYGNGTYIATASVPNNTIWYIFDNNINTYYEQATAFPYNYTTGTYIGSNVTTISSVSVSGEWFQVQLPTSIILRSYTLVGRQTVYWRLRNPTTFWIAGSNDGTTWSNVHQQSNINPPQDGITINVPTTSNSVPYTYYRLVVNVIGNSNNSDDQRNLVNLSSWNLYGDASSYAPNAAQDFYADRLGNLLTAPVVGQSLANWLRGATGAVTTWYDQSGRGNHATQATAANQPTINLSNVSVVFSGAQRLSNANVNGGFIPYGTSNYSVVTKHVNFTAGSLWMAGSNNGGLNGLRWATGNNYENFQGGGFLNFGPQPGTYPVVVSVVNNRTTNGNIGYVNGVQKAAATQTPNVPVVNQYIGFDNNAGSYMIGELNSVIFFSSDISSSDRLIVESLI